MLLGSSSLALSWRRSTGHRPVKNRRPYGSTSWTPDPPTLSPSPRRYAAGARMYPGLDRGLVSRIECGTFHIVRAAQISTPTGQLSAPLQHKTAVNRAVGPPLISDRPPRYSAKVAIASPEVSHQHQARAASAVPWLVPDMYRADGHTAHAKSAGHTPWPSFSFFNQRTDVTQTLWLTVAPRTALHRPTELLGVIF